jgi:hypothetical protein
MRPLRHPRQPGPLSFESAWRQAQAGARALDTQRRQDAADLEGTARCPRCRAPLVARMGRRGPYFHCRCLERHGRGQRVG